MTRGKHANAAAARAAREAAIAEAARLRSENADLKATVERLDRENLEQQAGHVAEVGALRRLIAANTSERLDEALRTETELRALLKTTETARRVLAAAFMRLADALQDAFEAQGMKPADAHERKMRICKIFPSFIDDSTPGFVRCADINATIGDARSRWTGGAEESDPDELARLHRLQRAKGLRA